MKVENSTVIPSRISREGILSLHREILEITHICELLDALPYPAGIVDVHRQIVLANKSLAGFLDKIDIESLPGSRPGEGLGCVNAFSSEEGCGTTPACRVCGILEVLGGSFEKNETITRECRVTARDGNRNIPYDLQVTASPIVIRGTPYAVLSILDVGGEKRRQALERIFFHDLINSAGGVKGLFEVLKQADSPEEYRVIGDGMGRALDNLMNEITTYRELAAAERGDLKVNPVPVLSSSLLRNTVIQFYHHPVAEGKSLDILTEAEDFIIEVDEVLVKRVLGNMTKNALEASGKGDRISLSCSRTGDTARFSVRNPGYIPEDIGLQIFQRSFSTKGGGRGLGTYSMRLLGEYYLHGRVGFTSSPGEGTRFHIDLPLKDPAS